MGRLFQAFLTIGIAVAVGLVVFVPAIIVTTQPYANWEFEPVVCGDITEDDRIDCFPEFEKVTARKCQMRGCCFQTITWDRLARIPECYFPVGVGYRMLGEVQELSEGYQVDLARRNTPRFFKEQRENIRFRAEFYKEDILHLKLYEYRYVDRTEERWQEWEDRGFEKRYEVPLEYPKTVLKNSWAKYEIDYQRNPFTFQVVRKRSGVPVIDTRIGGLVFEDQFLQLSMRIPNSPFYGLGEHKHRRFRHYVNWHTYGIFSADNEEDVEDYYRNLHGHHPFFMSITDNGDTFGVFFVNSNAQDVVLTPAPAVTFRTIGGVLDFWVFMGPTPEDVIQQYTEVIGRPHMPPFYALGYQFGRADWQSTEEMQEVVDRNIAAGVPFDVIYSDVGYMQDYKTFTFDDVKFAGLPEFVQELNAGGMKHVITINSGVSNQVPTPRLNYHFYYWGDKWGYYINETDKLTHVRGLQWPGEVEIADFTDPRTKDWYASFAYDFKDILPFDGVVMTMNEPGNFVNGSRQGCKNVKYNYPPWTPTLHSRVLYYRTICMESEQHLGVHYNVHSLNGHFAAEAGQYLMQQVKPDERSLVLSRATFAGTGRFAGHWLGENVATWESMYSTLIATLEFNLFGIPYSGPNTCGYHGNAELELCIRWTQMAAFFPLFRVYKGRDTLPADPAALGDEFLTNTRSAIQMRYRLLPYMYTQFYHARLDGWTVVRPVVNMFPSYENAWEVDWEFFLGPALLVSPVMHQGHDTVNMYLPDDRFYDFYTGESIPANYKDSNRTVPAPLDTVVLHMRGGYIIPMQEGLANSSEYSRKEPITLLIGIPEQLQEQSYGDLFWDDGKTWNSYERKLDLYLEFFADQNRIDILSQRVGMIEANPSLIDDLPVITDVVMYGMQNDPGSQVSVNKKAIDPSQFSYDSNLQVFRITGLNQDIISDHVIELGATANPF